MGPWVQIIVTAVCSVFASSGFWLFLQKYTSRNDAKADMLMGLGHDRIMYLGKSYVKKGYITADEFENINDYLFVPYEGLNGNGSAKRLIEEVRKLPIKERED